MTKWFFPTIGFGELEGFSNPGLEMFKGEPLRAMAREIVQNSLDAIYEEDKPVYIEFDNKFISPVTNFPGMENMRVVIDKCREFWKEENEDKTMKFISEADKRLRSSGIFVLRVSDYNTTGLRGAFSNKTITPWKSLVQGNAFSVKNSDSAGGSYGIGKAAPFVVSKLQTVFYRTYDVDGVRAAQGVTHLTSFRDESMALPGEDSIRRSTGYYSVSNQNQPFEEIPELEQLNKRTEYGTDLFIPAFDFSSGKMEWKDIIIIELLENFLYSIYAGKLVVKIDNIKLDKDTLKKHLERLMPKTKHAMCFYNVIRYDNGEVKEIKYKLYKIKVVVQIRS